MSVTGKIVNGLVVLPPGIKLPEGAIVKIETLSTQARRITNVDPLPAKVLKRLYGQADDDSDSIRLFMAAQAKVIEECSN